MILCLETSEKLCSVAVYGRGEVLSLLETAIERSHSGLITHLAEQALQAARIGFPELNAVALSSGPGSYTGLRVGASTAKGICFGRNLPLIAVPTLEALCQAVTHEFLSENCLLVPTMDARRQEVYARIQDREGQEHLAERSVVLSEYGFEDFLEGHVLHFFGSGAPKIAEAGLAQHPNTHFVGGLRPSAAYLGPLAEQRYQAGDFADWYHYQPNYLKPYQGLTLSEQQRKV